MAENTTPTSLKDLVDDICRDDASRRDKSKVLQKTWNASFFFSIQQGFSMLGGLLVMMGMATAGADIARAIGGEGVSYLMNNFSTVAGSVGGAAIAIVGAGLAATSVGIGAGFMGSRYHHDALLDQSEMNSQHTARYIVKELKKEATCLAPQATFDNPPRADGKTWEQCYAESQAVSHTLQRGA